MNARKMIRAVILGIAASAALFVSGCSDGNKAPDQGAVQKESPLMQKIKKQGKLVVGTASGYPPYEFIDTSVGEKKVIGIDMALAQKIADELGVKLEVQDMNFQALLTSLTGGKVDIAIAGINPTEERKKSMDFSADYLPTEQKVIIRKEDGSRYKKLEDLFGKTVGVQKSTTQEALAKEKIKDAKIVSLAHVPEVVLVVEGIVGGQYLVFNDDLMFSEVEFPNSVKSSAAAVQKGNEDVVAVVNKVIKENTDNGNFKKWTDEYSRKAVENADKQYTPLAANSITLPLSLSWFCV